MKSTGGKRNLYTPGQTAPYKLSRAKIELFMRCRRCFYFDRRHGINQPPMYPYTLNIAVDTLFKREFDRHRVDGTRHPLMEAADIDAVPYQHLKLEVWRNNFKGVQALHQPTNLQITGAIDDVWVTPKDELIVVDYKATSQEREVSIRGDWRAGYRRQIEVYQWLFRQNGFTVSPTSYFVYANGKTDRHRFDAKLEFAVDLLPYRGDPSWVEPALQQIKAVLEEDNPPECAADCPYCAYHQQLAKAETPGLTAEPSGREVQHGLFERLS